MVFCEWHGCGEIADTDLATVQTTTDTLILRLGHVCDKHAGELVATFDLFRKGAKARAERIARKVMDGASEIDLLADVPHADPQADPNRCARCGHMGTSHQIGSTFSAAKCLVCESPASGHAFEGGYVEPDRNYQI